MLAARPDPQLRPRLVAAALFLHRPYAVQSRGRSVRRVGWVLSSAMLVRREAQMGLSALRARAQPSDELPGKRFTVLEEAPGGTVVGKPDAPHDARGALLS